MATHWIDFDTYSPGAGIPTGWTATSNNGTATWSVVAVGGGIGNVLQGSNTSSSPSTLTYDGANGDSGRGTCEVTAKFRMTTLASAAGYNCGVVGRAQSGSATGYQGLLRQQATGNVVLRRAISTSIATSTNATIATPVVNTFYWMRIQCSGTAVRVRTWIDGSSEPGTWDIDTTDATHSDGPLGVAINHLAGVYQFRYVGIGTNGSAAPITAPGGGATAHHGSATLSPTTSLSPSARAGYKGSSTLSLTSTITVTTAADTIPPPTLDDLLSDPDAEIELIVRGNYLDEDNVQHTEWASQNGWDDEIGGLNGGYIPPLLLSTLRVDYQIDPLESLSSFPGFGNIELANNHLDHVGRYDSWWKYSVDGRDWIIYAVGRLSNGRRVELADVEDTPLYRLKGINIPENGSDSCTIRCRDNHDLNTALQPDTYSPPALYFPGSLTATVDLGNVINITGAQSLSAWVYLEDPASTLQYILFKDSGTTGYYLAVGLVGGGTIESGVEICVRGQSPAITTTAANVLQSHRWHRIDVSIDTTTRRIDIDGTTAITTAGIAGAPLSSTTSLHIGRLLRGRIHRVLYWSTALSNAIMSAEGRLPITGTETDLREAFMFAEGSGTNTYSSKSGSASYGVIGSGVLWDTASWHYESILGQYEPYVLGTVPRVPVTWIDPPKQVGQVNHGRIALLSELQSNHTAVSTANYVVNRTNGIVTVISGALSGSYSATITANNQWNSALYFDGATSRASALATMPAGSKYVGAHFRIDTISGTQRIIVNWPGTGHRLSLHIGGTPGVNVLSAVVVNDAGTAFTASAPIAIVRGVRYSAVGSVNTANLTNGLQLYLNGTLAATTAISGAFTGTQTTMGVGHRTTIPDQWFKGVIDEIIVGNIACTLPMAQDYHTLPVTSGFPGIQYGWHLDDATGSTAAPFAGVINLTLTNLTWTAGRSAAVDLARTILYSYGYVESDLDTETWLTALNNNPSDCGWFVTNGAKGIDILNIILGGLGFIAYKPIGGMIKIKRFEGLSGVADTKLDPGIDLQSQPIEPTAADPAIYLWTIIYATNNNKIDIANVAGGLATTDPARYHYGAVANLSATKSDRSILGRFPGAETRSRITALLNASDADREAVRLLAIHRYGADRKPIPVFLGDAGIEILSELGPLMSEVGLDNGDTIVTGVSIEEGLGVIHIWRPAVE